MNRRIARKVFARAISGEGRYRRTTLDAAVGIVVRDVRVGLRRLPVVMDRMFADVQKAAAAMARFLVDGFRALADAAREAGLACGSLGSVLATLPEPTETP